MLIDNAIWHARVDSFYALKSLLQYKLKTRKIPFSFQIVGISFLALSHIIKANLNNVHYASNRIVTKNMSLITKLLNLFYLFAL